MKFVIIVILFVVAGIWLKSRATPSDSRKSARVDLKKKLQGKKRMSATITNWIGDGSIKVIPITGFQSLLDCILCSLIRAH